MLYANVTRNTFPFPSRSQPRKLEPRGNVSCQDRFTPGQLMPAHEGEGEGERRRGREKEGECLNERIPHPVGANSPRFVALQTTVPDCFPGLNVREKREIPPRRNPTLAALYRLILNGLQKHQLFSFNENGPDGEEEERRLILFTLLLFLLLPAAATSNKKGRSYSRSCSREHLSPR